MRRLLLAIVLCAAVVVTGCGGPANSAVESAQHDGPGVNYYVSLGDSLAQGVQPDQTGSSVDTQQGYADQLYSLLLRHEPDLRLVKLGCPGESTTTMLSGNHCFYTAGSQLAAAVRFLRGHPGHISLVTIDIGANDPNSCFKEPRVPPCVMGAHPSTTANLKTIMTALRAATGSHVTIIGMTYYDPELAYWRDGRPERKAARQSDRPALAFDQALAKVYTSFGARVADVAGAFHTADFGNHVTLPGLGRLPRNVATVCQWTWQCAPFPRGSNKHPNTAGYSVIARAFLAADQQ